MRTKPVMTFEEWYASTLPEHRDAMNIFRRVLEKQSQFVLCIEGSSSRLCLNNADDKLVVARMLERFARWQRE